jgi:imidazole glycerol-phosphate synthase subunit HisH
MSTVVVVDYGMGNLRSVAQAVKHAAAGSGVQVQVSGDPAAVMAAERVVLPGQGAMRDCMPTQTPNSGWTAAKSRKHPAWA